MLERAIFSDLRENPETEFSLWLQCVVMGVVELLVFFLLQILSK